MKWKLTYKRNGWKDERYFETEEAAREWLVDQRDYSREHGEFIEFLGITKN